MLLTTHSWEQIYSSKIYLSLKKWALIPSEYDYLPQNSYPPTKQTNGEGTWTLRWRHVPGRSLWSRSQAYAHKADSFTHQGSHLEKRSPAVPRRRAGLGSAMFSFHSGSSISGSLSVFVFVIWDQVESPDWSWTLWVAEDDAELLVLLPPRPKCWIVGMPRTEQSLGEWAELRWPQGWKEWRKVVGAEGYVWWLFLVVGVTISGINCTPERRARLWFRSRGRKTTRPWSGLEPGIHKLLSWILRPDDTIL